MYLSLRVVLFLGTRAITPIIFFRNSYESQSGNLKFCILHIISYKFTGDVLKFCILVLVFLFMFFVLFDSLHQSQQFFSHICTGLPWLNQ